MSYNGILVEIVKSGYAVIPYKPLQGYGNHAAVWTLTRGRRSSHTFKFKMLGGKSQLLHLHSYVDFNLLFFDKKTSDLMWKTNVHTWAFNARQFLDSCSFAARQGEEIRKCILYVWNRVRVSNAGWNKVQQVSLLQDSLLIRRLHCPYWTRETFFFVAHLIPSLNTISWSTHVPWNTVWETNFFANIEVHLIIRLANPHDAIVQTGGKNRTVLRHLDPPVETGCPGWRMLPPTNETIPEIAWFTLCAATAPGFSFSLLCPQTCIPVCFHEFTKSKGKTQRGSVLPRSAELAYRRMTVRTESC